MKAYPMSDLTAALLSLKTGDALDQAISATIAKTDGRSHVGAELLSALQVAVALGWPADGLAIEWRMKDRKLTALQVARLAELEYYDALEYLVSIRACTDAQIQEMMIRSIDAKGKYDFSARGLLSAITSTMLGATATEARTALDGLNAEMDKFYRAEESNKH